MTLITRTDNLLQLEAHRSRLILDKKAGKAVFHRKILFMALKPAEVDLADLVDVTVDVGVDRASGVEVCNMLLISRGGGAWAFPADDKVVAERDAVAVRQFIGLPANA
ncbi:hypothetical protein RA307_11820 [Xanthobacteraceae bacterium Astr-EGSB]|uniref:hypothetical protein n=1 Tax=Astrobacterium formosum TaxID=3069710 RepID=UPI0027B3EBBB|nr:hypothetical protein [Xanthobacteraceae bacterium Astr-EGSB]